MRSKRLRFAVAGAACLSLVAAACGSDDDGDTAETTAAASPTTASGDAATTTAAESEGTEAESETTAAEAETTEAESETTEAESETTEGESETTEVESETTEAESETTAGEEPSGEVFTVPTENCPPSATEPLADGEPIKIGFIGPQTGPLASFGQIGVGMKIYFDKINEEGGVDGHPIELITKDDAYDAARSGPAVQEAIEGDGIFASVFQVGTPNVAGTRQLHAEACVPQALVGTGFPAWGDPQNFPWTTGGIPSYSVEAAVWAEFIKESFPDATKVAILSYNNDFGKAYQTALQELLPAAGLEIVADVVHEPTSDLSNEVTQLLASGPDVIIGGTTANFCTSLMQLARQGGFTGPILLSYTCAQAIQVYMAPAGEAAANVYSLVVVKDASDPAYAEDEAVQQYVQDVGTYGAGADPNIGNVLTGYNAGILVVDALERAASAEGGLTRATLMDAFWSFDLEQPLTLGGTATVNGIDDAYINEYGVMAEFDPAGQTYLIEEGIEIDAEGEGGVYEAP